MHSIYIQMNISNSHIYSFPWHLKWYSKYRSRTSPHFILFSRYILEKQILNFSPSLSHRSISSNILSICNRLRAYICFNQNKINSINSRQSLQSFSSKTFKFNFAKFVSSFIFTRLAINSAKDTGYMNSYQYFRGSVKILLGGYSSPGIL